MKARTGSVILLLAFALLIQNTCPHGFAGKTSLASACGHCPLKQIHVPPSQAQPNILSGASSLHFPFFVFSVPKTVHTFELQLVQPARLNTADIHEDAFPHAKTGRAAGHIDDLILGQGMTLRLPKP